MRAGDCPLDELFGNYMPVLLAAVVGFILVVTALIGARLLAPYSTERNKDTTYECGMLPIRRARTNVGMRFYLYAILFIIFDVEAVFLFPWALIFLEQNSLGNPIPFYAMMMFLVILFFAILYGWRKGVFEWQK